MKLKSNWVRRVAMCGLEGSSGRVQLALDLGKLKFEHHPDTMCCRVRDDKSVFIDLFYLFLLDILLV